MFKKIFLSVLVLIQFTACGASRQSATGPIKPKPMVTPWEYYQKAKPAVLGSEEEVKIQNAEVHTMGEDTGSDKTHYIIIGTIVGVSVIGGTVAGLMLAK